MPILTGQVTVCGGPPAQIVGELHTATGDVVAQVHVDPEGAYRCDLSPGRWTLNLWDALGHRACVEVELLNGEDKTLNIDLREPGVENRSKDDA